MTLAERVGFIGGDLDLTMLEDEAAVRLARKAPDSLEGTG
jgi:hypothetical protein